jgi:cytoskeletal protein RodZ
VGSLFKLNPHNYIKRKKKKKKKEKKKKRKKKEKKKKKKKKRECICVLIGHLCGICVVNLFLPLLYCYSLVFTRKTIVYSLLFIVKDLFGSVPWFFILSR